MATCTGASLGGHTRPLSSECVITSPPIMRVETPQEVFHTYSRPPAAVWYCTLNAFAKFWPRLCDVPDCSALLSCISASRSEERRVGKECRFPWALVREQERTRLSDDREPDKALDRLCRLVDESPGPGTAVD